MLHFNSLKFHSFGGLNTKLSKDIKTQIMFQFKAENQFFSSTQYKIHLPHHMFDILNLLICNLPRFATSLLRRHIMAELGALPDLVSCGHVRPLAHIGR